MKMMMMMMMMMIAIATAIAIAIAIVTAIAFATTDHHVGQDNNFIPPAPTLPMFTVGGAKYMWVWEINPRMVEGAVKKNKAIVIIEKLHEHIENIPNTSQTYSKHPPNIPKTSLKHT